MFCFSEYCTIRKILKKNIFRKIELFLILQNKNHFNFNDIKDYFNSYKFIKKYFKSKRTLELYCGGGHCVFNVRWHLECLVLTSLKISLYCIVTAVIIVHLLFNFIKIGVFFFI